MRNFILGILLSIPMLFFGQSTTSKQEVSRNMQDLKWGTESHVIQNSYFAVSKPLRETMSVNTVSKEKKSTYKEAPDKRDMPVQTFEYNVKEDGAEYGNDHSIIQKGFGQNNGKPN